MRERALPSVVRGPVLLAALRLFAVICFSEANFIPPLSFLFNVTSVPAWPHGLPYASQALSWSRRSAFPMKQADARSWQAPEAITETLGRPGRIHTFRSRNKLLRDSRYR